MNKPCGINAQCLLADADVVEQSYRLPRAHTQVAFKGHAADDMLRKTDRWKQSSHCSKCHPTEGKPLQQSHTDTHNMETLCLSVFL